ncbi:MULTISPECIES: hypothetical protein [unclassified Burkholderia]|uniref:hypothetical protein n=1 Tax=unclassified Burkholderia TaxID=2613784 RepID=UPI001181329F|nr:MULTISPECIES: hypothetical protein [unclassified Burkholderia]MCA8067687.1 hypothetical protein [Burkholderia sp. AU38729]
MADVVDDPVGEDGNVIQADFRPSEDGDNTFCIDLLLFAVYESIQVFHAMQKFVVRKHRGAVDLRMRRERLAPPRDFVEVQ